MVRRNFWLEQIQSAWKLRPIVWLSGVRRVGKTTLVKMIKDAVYLNCDLPSVQRQLEDPEFYLAGQKKDAAIIFDEIHRLDNPSIVLKIAADAYPHLRIIATGSSTLAATEKFRDSLTGRKTSIHLCPVLWQECVGAFNISDLDYRLMRGGLPEMLLSEHYQPQFYTEWIDSFYARDIQELFSIRNRTGFLNLLKLIMRQSGSLADYTQLAKLSGLSRPTVMSHIEALHIAHATYVIYPFHGGGRKEITQRPKIFGFDTGFVVLLKGWQNIRPEDRGYLWEHLALYTLSAMQPFPIHYWRDKTKNEIDFVIKDQNGNIDTFECKINPAQYQTKSLKTFRHIYPRGRNYVISPMINEPYKKRINGHEVELISLTHLAKNF